MALAGNDPICLPLRVQAVSQTRAHRGLNLFILPAWHTKCKTISGAPIMDEIVKAFLIESGKNLERLDQELVKLEADPKSTELLASIFRTIHTIKGTCGFLGFARLEKVAHAGENLLSRLRDGELSLTAEVTSGLLAMVDAVRHILCEFQATEHDGKNDYQALREELQRLQGSDAKPALESASAAAREEDSPLSRRREPMT